jgi:branched-chain amino acid transport system ATP-binding protein
MTAPALEVDAVRSGYGPVTVLRDVSIEVGAGEIVAILGGNGAGKSTLLKTITALLRPTQGDVRLNGTSLLGRSPETVARSGLVMVPEGRELFATMTVQENLMLGGYAAQRSLLGERLEGVLELFPALEEKLPEAAGNLSGGQQQMVAIGRALMADPEVLLLDEPSLGLAPMVLKEVFASISKLRERGTTILLIEQNAVMTLKLADRGYVMERGVVTISGAADALLRDPRVVHAYLGGSTVKSDPNDNEKRGT